jgi:phage repressor protein C with HTH and peptisase S24 domain
MIRNGQFFDVLSKQLPLVDQINPESIEMFLIKTQSMEPTLLLDDLLIILKDCQPETHGDGIYKIKINDAKKIRRTHVYPGNKIKITADSWKEDTIIVDFMNHPDVEFIGKVIFFLRKIENLTRNDQEDNLLKANFNGLGGQQYEKIDL